MTRIAIVKKDKCNLNKCSQECGKYCPINRQNKDCIIFENKALIDEELCTGCGICTKRCPFQAIQIINLPQEFKLTPLHQYGKNSFRLYRLPIPKFNQITGIIGKNGIGKTTVLEILSGNLIPNLNQENKNYNKVIEFFKGTEAQAYFEKLKNKKLRIAYKPQLIDKIPEYFKDKVIDLLKKVDEKKQLKEISKKLELENILNNNISEISGGELQRVAIAATILKEANIYFFDEPTSYLDIKQRLNVAKLLRSIVNEETAVIVVEHDLIILDYLTDYIYLMYGQETAYGISSHPKTTKLGINTYLEGYLKEENIRSRDKRINFLVKPPIYKKSEKILNSWTETSKKLNNFNLKINPGEINKEEIIGVIGENGIGKTTFIKILANELKPDEGEIQEKLKISYKPQHLNNNSEELVINLLKENSNFDSQKNKALILEPLSLEQLYNKKINQLSGGELQRIHIALCLLKEADLYLLDEPSAYLDIEQRLQISKAIKDFTENSNISALVVDHDLLFLDYFSDKLFVFEGKPSIEGICNGPFRISEGMNILLKNLDITMRRDQETNRPRINKLNSQMDRKQKQSNSYYSDK